MRPERIYYIYILASGTSGTLYVGMTNNLSRRVWEHREGLVEGFTKRYGVNDWFISRCLPRPQMQSTVKTASKNTPAPGN